MSKEKAPSVVDVLEDAGADAPEEGSVETAMVEETEAPERVAQEEVVEAEPQEGEVPQEDKSLEELLAEGNEPEEVQEEAEEEEVDDDGPVQLTRAEYEDMLDLMGDGEGEEEVVAPVVEPEPVVVEAPPEVVAPEPVVTFQMPENEDDMVDILSDPTKYAEHMQGFAAQIAAQTQTQMLAAIEPIIASRAIEAISAQKFNDKFFEENPDLIKRPQLVRKALAAAQKKLGADASWDDLYDQTNKNVAFARATKKSIDKSAKRTKDTRGKFAPKSTRKARPVKAQKQAVDPTEQFLADINQAPGNRDVAQLLNDLAI